MFCLVPFTLFSVYWDMEERQTCVLPKDILGVPSENSDIDKLSFRKVQNLYSHINTWKYLCSYAFANA